LSTKKRFFASENISRFSNC